MRGHGLGHGCSTLRKNLGLGALEAVRRRLGDSKRQIRGTETTPSCVWKLDARTSTNTDTEKDGERHTTCVFVATPALVFSSAAPS